MQGIKKIHILLALHTMLACNSSIATKNIIADVNPPWPYDTLGTEHELPEGRPVEENLSEGLGRTFIRQSASHAL